MEHQLRKKALSQYFLFSFAALLINASGYVKTIEHNSLLSTAFCAVVLVSYCLLYMLPGLLLLMLLNYILDLTPINGLLHKCRIRPQWVFFLLAVAIFSCVQIFIFADKFIYSRYGFHFNGFVWNIVRTPGGIASLGGGRATDLTFALVLAAFAALQAILLYASVFVVRRSTLCCARVFRIARPCLLIFIFIAAVSQGVVYGISSLQGYVPVLAAAKAFPLYQPVTFKKLASKFGVESKRNPAFEMKVSKYTRLNYPLKPLGRIPEPKRHNIVWLVAESWRYDMLDPNIMPTTWEFAGKAMRFTNHYSGGNGTRMGLFAMFYGLYGNYWFSFLDERRPPVLMDLLTEDNYQFAMFTSAAFTYPEFDKTIFAGVDSEDLHAFSNDQSWKSDQKNVSKMIEFLEDVDTARPFMTFMFFESPHARYYFPPENVIRPEYLKEFNYATVDLEHDIGLIENRYINSCNHLDSQFERIIRYLEDNGLLDSTIVIITGDHGEEFMEKGRWGHNSAFTEEQVRVPMVLWVPGCRPRISTTLTSHLDIAPTVMKLLGVTNPLGDYCLGYDLLDDTPHDYIIMSDWDNLAYVDADYKAVFPLNVYDSIGQHVTTRDDGDIEDPGSFYDAHRDALVRILTEARRFAR